MRIDKALFDAGLVRSRSLGAKLIGEGCVFYDGAPVTKVSAEVEADPDRLKVVMPDDMYVGRGGKKLEKALDDFGTDVSGRVCADIGASTGGFTDCLLRRGAKKVFAVDVGSGQLDISLQNDPRVCNMENVNARYLEEGCFEPAPDLVVCDASFISLKLLLPAMKGFSSESADLICLIKPQFEAGRESLNKQGVVRDKKVHIAVIKDIMSFAAGMDLEVCGLTDSPIKGQNGNTEYLIWLHKGGGLNAYAVAAETAVSRAFETKRS